MRGGPALCRVRAPHLGAGLRRPIDGHFGHPSEIGHAHLLDGAQHVRAEALIRHLQWDGQGWAPHPCRAPGPGDPQKLPSCPATERPRSSRPAKPIRGRAPGRVLTSTRAPLARRSPGTASSGEPMSACSRYSSGCRHIHLLKLRAKPRGYCRRGAGGARRQPGLAPPARHLSASARFQNPPGAPGHGSSEVAPPPLPAREGSS